MGKDAARGRETYISILPIRQHNNTRKSRGSATGRIRDLINSRLHTQTYMGPSQGVNSRETRSRGVSEGIHNCYGVVEVDDCDLVGMAVRPCRGRSDQGCGDCLASGNAKVLGVGGRHGAGGVDYDSYFATAVGGGYGASASAAGLCEDGGEGEEEGGEDSEVIHLGCVGVETVYNECAETI
jgi:hypothetical protein